MVELLVEGRLVVKEGVLELLEEVLQELEGLLQELQQEVQKLRFHNLRAANPICAALAQPRGRLKKLLPTN